jgi:chromosome segregation ATPase
LEENIFQLNEELELERKNFSIKTQEMENNFQNEMSKKDEELDELRQSLDIKLDDTNQKMLQETLQKLRKEILEKNQKIKDLEKINDDLQNTKNPVKGFFMKGSNINDTL